MKDEFTKNRVEALAAAVEVLNILNEVDALRRLKSIKQMGLTHQHKGSYRVIFWPKDGQTSRRDLVVWVDQLCQPLWEGSDHDWRSFDITIDWEGVTHHFRTNPQNGKLELMGGNLDPYYQPGWV